MAIQLPPSTMGIAAVGHQEMLMQSTSILETANSPSDLIPSFQVGHRASLRQVVTLAAGRALEDAVKIFDGPTLEQIDDRTDYGEVRTYAIGLVNGFEVVVIYTETAAGERRIISAWRAERNERKAYWEIFS